MAKGNMKCFDAAFNEIFVWYYTDREGRLHISNFITLNNPNKIYDSTENNPLYRQEPIKLPDKIDINKQP